jgi:hypothetical protein
MIKRTKLIIVFALLLLAVSAYIAMDISAQKRLPLESLSTNSILSARSNAIANAGISSATNVPLVTTNLEHFTPEMSNVFRHILAVKPNILKMPNGAEGLRTYYQDRVGILNSSPEKRERYLAYEKTIDDELDRLRDLTRFLKPGMTRAEVTNLFGAPVKQRDDNIQYGPTYVGFSPDGVSWRLGISFDNQNRVTRWDWGNVALGPSHLNGY